MDDDVMHAGRVRIARWSVGKRRYAAVCGLTVGRPEGAFVGVGVAVRAVAGGGWAVELMALAFFVEIVALGSRCETLDFVGHSGYHLLRGHKEPGKDERWMDRS